MLSISAPAKVNLSLRVLRRREDGFHDIQTRMVAISLADTLTLKAVSESGGVEFTCSDASLPINGDNLVLKAIEALRAVVGTLPGLRVHLEKRVPHGAGLGGGSSDAASALLGLNQLLDLGLSVARLAEISASFGSDVPFFVYGTACDCGGRGEEVVPVVEALPALPLLLVKPTFGVPTPWAYRQWQGSREIPGVFYGEQTVQGQTMVNDLERPVFEKYVLLADLKMWLRSQPEVAAAMMSGSGSTMMAILREEAAGEVVAERARREFG